MHRPVKELGELVIGRKSKAAINHAAPKASQSVTLFKAGSPCLLGSAGQLNGMVSSYQQPTIFSPSAAAHRHTPRCCAAGCGPTHL